MKWVLTCDNGKEIDMSYYIGQQMENKITRQDVLDRIEFINQLINYEKIYTRETMVVC